MPSLESEVIMVTDSWKVTDSNVSGMPGTGGRFLRLATLQKGLREVVCFIDAMTHKSYIEEITTGQLQRIETDEEWNELAELCAPFITIHQGDDPNHPRVKALGGGVSK